MNQVGNDGNARNQGGNIENQGEMMECGECGEHRLECQESGWESGE